jgi:hypothetical protein
MLKEARRQRVQRRVGEFKLAITDLIYSDTFFPQLTMRVGFYEKFICKSH